MLEQLQVLILKMNYELWLQTNKIKKNKKHFKPTKYANLQKKG